MIIKKIKQLFFREHAPIYELLSESAPDKHD